MTTTLHRKKSKRVDAAERRKHAEFLIEVRERNNAQRNRRKQVLIDCAGCMAARFVNKSGMALFVHKSTRTDRDGEWQITSFGQDGKPWGHTCADSFEEAILRCVGASKSGYWNEHGYTLVETIKGQA